MKAGDYVHYTSPHGAKENGRVKRISEQVTFVVFHCDGYWQDYCNYTAASTATQDLQPGWVDADGNTIQTPEQ